MDDVTALIEEIRTVHEPLRIHNVTTSVTTEYCVRCQTAWPCPPVRAADMLEKPMKEQEGAADDTKLAKLAEATIAACDWLDNLPPDSKRPTLIAAFNAGYMALACRVLAL